jgi:hypothetical protein
VRLGHGITVRLAAIPDEGYRRAVFFLLLAVDSELEVPQF